MTIEAADAAGAFYGRTTLAQLARVHDGRLPVGTVRDWPDLSERGVMLDISRDKVPTMETLFALVDRLAEWKVNQVQLYSEHTFAYADHEVVWRDASPMTAEEIDALDAYCADRHIELVPNQNCLGHMNRWLLHDEYRHWRWTPTGYVMMGMRRPPSTIEPTEPRVARPGARAARRAAPALLRPAVRERRSRRAVGAARASASTTTSSGSRTLPRRFRSSTAARCSIWGDILAGDPDRLGELPGRRHRLRVGLRRRAPVGGASRRVRGARASRCGSRPGRRAGSRSSAAPPTCAPTAPRRSTPRVAHGAGGMLNTDWGDNGHLQYLPISDPGLAYGAAVGGARRRTGPRSRRRAVDALLRRPAGVLGETSSGSATCTYGSRRRCGTCRRSCCTLYWPQLDLGRGPLKGVAAEEYDAVEADLDALRGRDSTPSPPTRRMPPLVLDELRNAIALVRVLYAPTPAPASLSAARWPPVDALTRRALADELRPVIAEHERLWLARNRPGGLRDSRAWLEHLLGCYETGVDRSRLVRPAVARGRPSGMSPRRQRPTPRAMAQVQRGAPDVAGATGLTAPTAKGWSPPQDVDGVPAGAVREQRHASSQRRPGVADTPRGAAGAPHHRTRLGAARRTRPRRNHSGHRETA